MYSGNSILSQQDNFQGNIMVYPNQHLPKCMGINSCQHQSRHFTLPFTWFDKKKPCASQSDTRQVGNANVHMYICVTHLHRWGRNWVQITLAPQQPTLKDKENMKVRCEILRLAGCKWCLLLQHQPLDEQGGEDELEGKSTKHYSQWYMKLKNCGGWFFA